MTPSGTTASAAGQTWRGRRAERRWNWPRHETPPATCAIHRGPPGQGARDREIAGSQLRIDPRTHSANRGLCLKKGHGRSSRFIAFERGHPAGTPLRSPGRLRRHARRRGAPPTRSPAERRPGGLLRRFDSDADARRPGGTGQRISDIDARDGQLVSRWPAAT